MKHDEDGVFHSFVSMRLDGIKLNALTGGQFVDLLADGDMKFAIDDPTRFQIIAMRVWSTQFRTSIRLAEKSRVICIADAMKVETLTLIPIGLHAMGESRLGHRHKIGGGHAISSSQFRNGL